VRQKQGGNEQKDPWNLPVSRGCAIGDSRLLISPLLVSMIGGGGESNFGIACSFSEVMELALLIDDESESSFDDSDSVELKRTDCFFFGACFFLLAS
jgi:hypothetical protein